jgi:hypothetical protein
VSDVSTGPSYMPTVSVGDVVVVVVVVAVVGVVVGAN